MKTAPRAVLAFIALAVLPLSVLAAGDKTAGFARANTCLGCHGIPNYNNVYPTYRVPRLGGQHPAYIVAALKAYKAGERKHPTMQAQASGLSDKDMEDIAAYIASVSAPTK